MPQEDIFFAWVANGNTTWGPEHLVKDEQLFGVSCRHQEGGFAHLGLLIRNPRVGLLGAARKRWTWLSYQPPVGAAVPLFHGRLVGIPQDLDEELITIEFLARPNDYDAQLAALAASMKIAPFWDPVFVAEDKRNDPHAVLTGYSKRWHIGRTDKTVTTSDILNPEDGVEVFEPGDFFYESLRVSHSGEPTRAINVEGQVMWHQSVSGLVDISIPLDAAFGAAGSGGQRVTSFTGQGLEKDWRIPGDTIGGGWSYAVGDLNLISGLEGSNREEFVLVNVISLDEASEEEEQNIAEGVLLPPEGQMTVPLWEFSQTTVLAYVAQRQYTEIVRFTVKADVQDVLTDEDDPKTEEFRVQSDQLLAEIDDNASDTGGSDGSNGMPIGDLRHNTYFNRARGRRSIEFLMACARARLLSAARAGDVSIEIPFDRAIALSCRKGASIADDRIPGGGAVGKIVAYGFTLDVASGIKMGSMQIAGAIGRGDALGPPAAGAPTYVEEGYVSPGYQFYEGADVIPFAGELSYTDFVVRPADDGLDFFRLTHREAIDSLVVVNGEDAQRDLLTDDFSGDPQQMFLDPQDVLERLNEIYTHYDLLMKPVEGGPYETIFNLTVSDLVVPRNLDLEAA